MPQRFREKYTNTSCIIYCIETTLRKPHNLDSRGESCSIYYSSNTLMYLDTIALCGLVMFISVYGGRSSNRFIIAVFGFLKYHHPGNKMMADISFIIRDLLFETRVNLVLAVFTGKGGQMSGEDVTGTKKIANEHIPLEWVIRRLKVLKNNPPHCTYQPGTKNGQNPLNLCKTCERAGWDHRWGC